MTPKEKAKDLVSKYIHLAKQTSGANGTLYNSKQCALIAVDLRLDGDFIFTSIEYGQDSLEYWQQVKQEIKTL